MTRRGQVWPGCERGEETGWNSEQQQQQVGLPPDSRAACQYCQWKFPRWLGRKLRVVEVVGAGRSCQPPTLPTSPKAAPTIRPPPPLWKVTSSPRRPTCLLCAARRTGATRSCTSPPTDQEIQSFDRIITWWFQEAYFGPVLKSVQFLGQKITRTRKELYTFGEMMLNIGSNLVKLEFR